MIRVTTNGNLINYKTSLNKSANQLNNSRNKVLTQRNFNSYAEDPAAATQAFRLRRALARTNDQLSSTQTVLKKFTLAESSIKMVKSDLTEAQGKVSALKGISDATGTGRVPLGEVLKSAAESVVQAMNAQYGTAFVFSGNDALGGAPFSTGTDARGNPTILYRGVDVNAVRADGAEGEDPEIMKVLDAMNGEKSYVDAGAGMTEVDGELVNTSVFNTALSGIDFLGYGQDADGDPKNVAALMSKLGSIFSACNPDDGAYNESVGNAEDAVRLAGKLEDALGEITNRWTEMGGQTTYLETNATRLTTMQDDLTEQILNIEQVDLAGAITDFSWAQYCYNSALKVGSNLLSQSLIDYMN